MKRVAFTLLFLSALLHAPAWAAPASSDKAAARQRMQELLALATRSNSVYSVLEAAAAGDAEVLKARLEEGDANVNMTDEAGNMPIHLAARGKSSRVMQMLLKAGADPQAKDANGKTALELCRHGGMRTLLKKAEGAREMEIEVDAMVKSGDTRGVRKAIKAGVNPNALSADNKGTLLMSAVQSGQLEMLELLLELGAHADCFSAVSGLGVLHLAAKTGNAQIIKRLLKAGADPMRLSANGASPLHDAVWHNQLAALKALLPAYKKVNFSPEKASHGHPINMAIYRSEDEFVQAFIDAGLDLNDKRMKDQPPLVFATQRKRASVVKMFLEAGADKNVKDPSGKTAADYATPETASLLR